MLSLSSICTPLTTFYQFHFRPTPHPQNVRRRIKQLKDYISVTSDWISYALIDDITDAFGPLIQSIEYEVDSIDELVLILKDTEQSDMLRRIGTCRKKVMGLLRLMGNKADVVKGLAKRCNENWRVAPTSDIVCFCTQWLSTCAYYSFSIFLGFISLGHPSTYWSFIPFCWLIHFVVGPSYYHDSKSEPLRKNSLPIPFKLFGPDFY